MKTNLAVISAIFIIAICLRFYDYGYPSFKWMDEQMHVPAAIHYWDTGQFEPEMWEHPPLRQIIFKGFLSMFGDNPLGWRIRNIITGAGVALLTFLFAYETCGSRRAALLAGLLIATDPLHIVLSRYTYDEIYGSFVFLAGLVIFLKHRQRCSMLLFSSMFIGCAIAIKWNYLPVLLLLICLALYTDENYRKPGNAFFIICTYLLVPAAIYLLTYFPWFGRGYSLAELAEMAINSYQSLQKWRTDVFSKALFFIKHPSAAEWFVQPVMVGQGTYKSIGEGRGEFVLYINNLPIWILTIPSMIALSIQSIKEKNLRLALPALFFISTYMLYLCVKRPIFIYTAATLLPFAFTTIAFCITRLADRFSVRIYYAALAVILAWNLYLYPLVTAKKIPVAAYRFILERTYINLAQ